MRRVSVLSAFAGLALLVPLLGSASGTPHSAPPAWPRGAVPGFIRAAAPTRVGPDQAAAGAFLRPIEYGLPAYPAPPYGPPDYIAAPEVLSRIGDLLGAINNPDERSRLAKQWLDYCKKVIAQDMEYREQWLDLQKQQLAQQQQQVEQLRLEVARLQAQVDELRARNTQLEQQSFPAQAYLAPTPAGP